MLDLEAVMQMAEYIDKEIVKEAIGMIANACLANPRITCGEIQTFFEGIPTADVRPVVRGRWEGVEVTWLADVEDQPDAIASMFCSECRRFANRVYHYGDARYGMNFCPWCGARMGGDAK